MKYLRFILPAIVVILNTGCITSPETMYNVTIRNTLDELKYGPALVVHNNGEYIATIPSDETVIISVKDTIKITAKRYDNYSDFRKTLYIISDTTIKL